MNVTEDTKAIAKGVLDYIEKYPERHQQHSWFVYRGYGLTSGSTKYATRDNMCNTTMCVAGTAVFLTSTIEEFQNFSIRRDSDWQESGAKLLGLSNEESQWLFYEATNWEALRAVEAITEGNQEKFDKVRFGT